jgi:hypothetical protein
MAATRGTATGMAGRTAPRLGMTVASGGAMSGGPTAASAIVRLVVPVIRPGTAGYPAGGRGMVIDRASRPGRA